MADIVPDRNKTITRASTAGIIANVLLSAFKAVVGLLSHSIAIVLDAVNNLTDALSLVITIIGVKLGSKPADKEHPYGYGRAEFLSQITIAVLILFAGGSALVESIKKILHPTVTTYTTVTIVVILVAIATKIWLSIFTRRKGRETDSAALTASGKEAGYDALVTFATLVSVLIYLKWKIVIDGWLGAGISLLIVKAGWDALKESVDKILGQRSDAAFTKAVKKDICSIDGVEGAYDLMVHNYGPGNSVGSVHVAVDHSLTAPEIYNITTEIQQAILEKHHLFLTVGIYSVDDNNPETKAIRDSVTSAALSREYVLSIHALYIDVVRKRISFDIVVDFKCPDATALRDGLASDICATYPGYSADIKIDRDISD